MDGDNSFGIAVAFARTPEGQRVAAALREALSEGAPVELAGTRLARESGQDVQHRAPGGEVPPETIQVNPLVQARSWPVRIEVESPEGRAAYPRVDLRYASSYGSGERPPLDVSRRDNGVARAFLDPVLLGDEGTWDPPTWTWRRGE